MKAAARGRQGGLLFVLSGPSGVGKDSVIRALLGQGLPLRRIVTATTRPPRPGEADGVDYHFVSTEAFERMKAQGELLEYATVHGHHYGTPRRAVREALAQGQDVLLKIDVQGATQVKRRVPETILIFLAPPDAADLVERMKGRGTETSQELGVRLRNAQAEMERLSEYDYVVVNYAGRLEEAVEKVKAIVVAEGCRVRPRPGEG